MVSAGAKFNFQTAWHFRVLQRILGDNGPLTASQYIYTKLKCHFMPILVGQNVKFQPSTTLMVSIMNNEKEAYYLPRLAANVLFDLLWSF